ncbi:MAG: SAM-dependent methyltransferase [Verrucomicrobia bacterium]|nr:MAG: SAM-dependent methyltransferase [Verrucomicrobiota bacterium]
MKFKDHFSGHAVEYAKFRPRYPDKLFEYLASISPRHGLAWDCATGNGQAAVGLIRHFDSVIATDASAQQIESAEPNDRITYRVAPAEASGIDSSSVDLILVAQALHWFDIERFFTEAKRVLKENAVLAISSYKVLEIAPETNAIIWNFYRETTGSFWPPERELVETDYKDIKFPFAELPPIRFDMHERWNLHQLAGYFRTWSATQRFIAARGFDPVDSLVEELRALWKNPEEVRDIKWPLHLRVGVLQK